MPYFGQRQGGTTARDPIRLQLLAHAIKEAGLDAVVATLPENVLLLSGYFPVVGTSLALATRDGEVFCLAPRDERELAEQGGADHVLLFEPAALNRLIDTVEAAREPVADLLRQAGLSRAVIGYESGAFCEPASYASVYLYGTTLRELFDGVTMRPAVEFFSRMKAVLTPLELERVARACRIAGLAVSRADGYAFCMSGEHSAQAFGAYARSRATRICSGDLALSHCNSHADGYWTDITRTYSIGEPDERQRKMYAAVFEARQAALAAIRPGVRACEIDRAARDVMRGNGLGDQFKHPTGHGVGFSATNHNALPRIHPQSEDRIETGMVFNIEPAAYEDGFGGLRHCDMVAVTAAGAKLLTPYQCTFQEMIR